MDDVLARLREAHLHHELSLWRGGALTRTLEDQVRALFGWFSEVKLDDVVTRAQVFQVIERYAIDLRVSGGITELGGEMSHVVFTSPATASARLADILTPEMFEEFADKVLALEGVRRELLASIGQSATAYSISTGFVARALLDLLAVSMPIPRVLLPAASERLSSALLPVIERLVGQALARHRAQLTERGVAELLDSERLRAVVDELWDRFASRPLSELFAFVGEQDIEDFVVLVHEFWLRYRKTDFFRRIAAELVDFFFEKYGQTTLLALIDDMGVTEAMVRREVVLFLPPMFEEAAVRGALERHIRARLDGFYGSAAAAAALGG
ncbi:MAG TPA: hypothetical protein VJR89_27500 [Polyangiales bacterium]|nr:hypothetical protein [Polyangiales bacterium]